jgi:hypothetical protein
MITDCPMCHNAIPNAGTELVKACTSCGADLTRWLPKRPKISPATAAAAAPTIKSVEESNLGLGILGALLGAGVGVGVMFGFYQLMGFRFPLLGVGTGCLTALGARWLNKGGENRLGIISGVIAMVAVAGTLYLMYGEIPIISVISVIVSLSVAYRIAAR